MGEGCELPAFAERRASPPQQAHRRQLRREPVELHEQPGLAHPCFAGDDDSGWMFAFHDIEQLADEATELRITADERSLVAQSESGGTRWTQTDKLVRRYGFALSLQPQRWQRPPRRQRHRREGCFPAGEDSADTSGVRK